MSDTSRPDAPTLRHQVTGLPAYVVAAWRTRYAVTDGVDLQARAVLSQEAAALRAEGETPDARAVWMRLADQVVRYRDAAPELVAAASLAGLAAGVRPHGFDPPAAAAPNAPGA